MKSLINGLRFNSMPLRRAFVVWGHGYGALADLVGCTAMTCRNAIAGKHPTSKHLPKIASVLGVNMNECWSVDEEVA